MRILSHRGYWKVAAEKNMEIAFRRSFSLGFGTETDIRDFCGELVVSHDPPQGGEMPFARFLEIYAEYEGSLPLALNVKADGLQSMVGDLLSRFKVNDAFFFDMSVPDALGYLKAGLPVYTRVSEYEKNPAFYERAHGIWVDAFYDEWYDDAVLQRFLNDDKSLCIVSSELHKRCHLKMWEKLIDIGCLGYKSLSICTDYPECAKKFFAGKLL